jgi:hypothetical protein
MLIRTIAMAAAVLTTIGCDQRAALERLVPKDDATFAINAFDELRNRDFGPVEALLDKSILSAATRPQLEQIAAAFGNDAAQDVHVIGAFSNTINGATTNVNLTLEYRLPQSWLVAAMSLHRTDGARTIDAIRVQPTADSQEHLNRFTFSGKRPSNYAILGSTIIVFAFIVGTLVILWKTRVPRRKWLWALFVAIGIGQFTLNWTTGQVAIQPLQVSLLGAGFAKPGPYGPWFLCVAMPIGAVIFLIRRRQWLANMPSLQPTSDAAA